MTDPREELARRAGKGEPTPQEQRLQRHDVLNAHEERLLRTLDCMRAIPEIDQAWLADARRQIELGFMGLHRAIARPLRASLPDDEQAA